MKNNDKLKKFILCMFLIIVLKAIAQVVLVDNLYANIDAEECTYQEFTDFENKGEIDKVFIDFEEELAKNKFFFTVKDSETIYEADYPSIENFKINLLEKDVKIYPRSDIYEELNIVNFGMFLNYEVIDSMLTIFMYVLLFSYIVGMITNFSSDNFENNTKKGKMSDTTFDDVAGLKEVKQELCGIVDFVKDGEKYSKAGAKLPNGIIFYGPPGTGKTLLARAIAGEADVPFYYMSGSDFVELYVGMGAKRVRALFAEAKKNAPSIIFIDEIDAIGSNRGKGDGNSEDRKTLNALLTEIDGFKENNNVIVIGATNRLQDIDKALLRAGRFTEKYYIPKPETKEERLEVIELYTKNKKLAEDVDLKEFAKETLGCSPADIEAILNDAMILAVQNGKEYITKEFLDKAYYKRIVGGHPKENSDREQEEIEICAIHEAGHTVAGVLLGQDVTKVTIVPSTNGAGGITFLRNKKLGLYTAEELKNQIKCLYAGRVAEYLYTKSWDKVTTGASDDLRRATEIIRDYIAKYGMDDNIKFMTIDDKNNGELKTQMGKMSNDLREETIALLNDNLNILIELKDELIKKETLSSEEILNIVKKKA